MVTAREKLNELKWREEFDFTEVQVVYIHRGAPNDVMFIGGNDIISLDRSFMQTTEAYIPYHRIIQVQYKGEIIWKRLGVDSKTMDE
jgi:uncharacterized protein (UPF0248 family)